MRKTILRFAGPGLVLVVTLIGGLLGVWGAAIDRDLSADQHLSLYRDGLAGWLARFRTLPLALALDGDVRILLAKPDDPAAVNALCRKLEQVNAEAATAEIFLMDAQGLTRAASNWRSPGSFMGGDFRFRPYFTEALASGEGRYYGVGINTGIPGYFQSHAVTGPDGLLGVIVAKIDLAPLVADWRAAGERVMITDQNGISFLATDPELLYRVLHPITAAQEAILAETRQYHGVALRPLGPNGLAGAIYTQPIAEEGWAIHLILDPAPLWRAGLGAAGVAWAGAVTVLLLLNARRHRLALRGAERRLTQDLERRVMQQTDDLRRANGRLQAEIDERVRAEAGLRAAQADLMQSTKLAALGRMSAAIAHELNQPLAGMRLFLSSGAMLVATDDRAGLGHLFDRLSGLVDRMARITGQLKGFARKAPNDAGVASIAGAVAAARALLPAGGPPIRCAIPQDAAVRADSVRLEQILINLLRNAVEAVTGRADGAITVEAVLEGRPAARSQGSDQGSGQRSGQGSGQGSVWCIRVIDNGDGIDPAIRPHLFEPFVTTKAPDQGLGLGLWLSAAMVEAFGGRLTAHNRGDGGNGVHDALYNGVHDGIHDAVHDGGAGAVFIIDLPAAGDTV